MAVPPMHPSRRTQSPEYYLNIVKMPCDRVAAAMAARSAAEEMRRSSVPSILVPLIFVAVFLFFLVQFSIAGFAGIFMIFFLMLLVLAIGSMLMFGARMSGIAEDLEELASAIESGVLDKDVYCDKTLYQALMEYKARRERGLGRQVG